MKKAILALIGLALLAIGWYFGSPLFIDETVDESFEFALPSGGVDMSIVMSMPEKKRVSMMNDIMSEAAKAPDFPMSEELPAASPVVVAQGRFADADAIHKGNGQATLYRLPDNSYVLRFEDFKTTNGPALVVYLTKHASPASATDVTDHGFVSLGKLKGNVGNQNYPVPNSVNISEYNSVVIWCELFGVLFSPAGLHRT